MSYIKKEFRALLDLTDRQFIIPKTFQRFISEKEKTHNLIIKSKKEYRCTNCGYIFQCKAKVNQSYKCPNCKQKLLVKTDRLTHYVFRDNLQLLDKIQDKFVVRTFELYSNFSNNKIEHSITEFMRSFVMGTNQIYDFVTNQVHNHMGYMYISHYEEFTHWRARNFRWAYRDVYGMVCPYNVKNLIKNTSIQYSELQSFLNFLKNKYICISDYLTCHAYMPSFEILNKMKLYYLAMNAPDFHQGKSFEEVFGVPKTFYPFMKKHNIIYRELKVLRILKKKDIRLIRKLAAFSCLKEISQYVDLEKAYYKVLKFYPRHEIEYLDYLNMCSTLHYDLHDKKILYPDNLMEAHDSVTQVMKEILDKNIDSLIQERAKDLEKNIYKNNQFIVFPAPSLKELRDEAEQQHNCVYKNYSKSYATGKCDIYFLRLLTQPHTSFVTIEVRGQQIVQSKMKYNNPVAPNILPFLESWEKKVLEKV